VEQIIGALKPRVVILTHFGLSVWRAKPWQVAQRLSEKTGVKVIAAWDGLKFDLTELESIERKLSPLPDYVTRVLNE
ncbi:MAG: hypothetical protein HYU85_01500, partial [Chloroflexi bacterium]|nr:hypothetical protein [Chloroflexota bacterium]